jgi:isocitrate dehydrogenase
MHQIAFAKGDGIGPEIMDATMKILDAAKVPINWHEIAIGEKVYLSGESSGIDKNSWDTLRRCGVFLKAPITTPRGEGYKSLNVTLRKTLGLFANVRPCRSFHPFVPTRHPDLDLVVIRENEEDLYAGIEHQQTDEVVQCLKLISRPGCEKIVRYAFDYARVSGRRKVSCFTKDNIMKLTDGLFLKVFREIAAEYPDIENDSWIIDIGAARIADTPERFDVVVMPNLYGDIVSDITAQLTGSVGLAGSANVGAGFAMFEAIHGSAPDIAGQKIANPSGLLRAAIMMLHHLGEQDKADLIKNAWLCTLEQKIFTQDIYQTGQNAILVSTDGFAEAVIEQLGNEPKTFRPVRHSAKMRMDIKPYVRPEPKKKELDGVDVFVHWAGTDADELAASLVTLDGAFSLTMITNRGVKVWPDGFKETFCTDHWRCRFEKKSDVPVPANADVAALLKTMADAGIDFIKTEHLYRFDGVRGYSLGQGQ